MPSKSSQVKYEKIRARKTPNMDIFHTVIASDIGDMPSFSSYTNLKRMIKSILHIFAYYLLNYII